MECCNVDIDRLDRKIISLLQHDARITNQHLADSVGLSPSACLNRVRKLEAAGVLTGYLAAIDLHSLCRFREFRDAVEAIPEVVESYTVSGAIDLFLRIIAADMPRYNAVNDQILDLLPGKVHISSHVVLENGKPFSGYPLSALLDDPA
mgnify:CR=1 FL=1